MKEWKDKFGRILKNQKFGKDSFLIMILGGILLLIIAWPTSSGKRQQNMVGRTGDGETTVLKDQAAQSSAMSGENHTAYAAEMEERLTQLLESVQGVGKVQVMITYASGYELVPLQETTRNSDRTEETDANGGTRTILAESLSQETVYTVDEQGNQVPYVLRMKEPEIIGVAVCAQGGGEASIRQNITEVIQSLFRIEANRIIVTRMKS